MTMTTSSSRRVKPVSRAARRTGVWRMPNRESSSACLVMVVSLREMGAHDAARRPRGPQVNDFFLEVRAGNTEQPARALRGSGAPSQGAWRGETAGAERRRGGLRPRSRGTRLPTPMVRLSLLSNQPYPACEFDATHRAPLRPRGVPDFTRVQPQSPARVNRDRSPTQAARRRLSTARAERVSPRARYTSPKP